MLQCTLQMLRMMDEQSSKQDMLRGGWEVMPEAFSWQTHTHAIEHIHIVALCPIKEGSDLLEWSRRLPAGLKLRLPSVTAAPHRPDRLLRGPRARLLTPERLSRP